MAYAILNIEKMHSFKEFTVAANHNFRLAPDSAPLADHSRTVYNRELVAPGRHDYKDLWRERQYEVAASGGSCVPRKGAVLAYGVLLDTSRGGVPDEKIPAWCDKNILWLSETFGERNVLSAVLHMDEAIPHIHAVVIPIDERGHLCAYSFTGKRSQMRMMQDSYARAMEEFGLERGEKYSQGGLIDEGLHGFYRRASRAIEKKVPPMQENEPVADYALRLQEWARDLLVQSYEKERKWKRKYVVEQARRKQDYINHAGGIVLYDDLLNRSGGRGESDGYVNRKIGELIDFVREAPLATIDSSITYLKDTFAKGENLEYYAEPCECGSDGRAQESEEGLSENASEALCNEIDGETERA